MAIMRVRRPLATVGAFTLVFAEIGFAAISAAQNAQLLEWIPARFLSPEWLLAGFGVALALLWVAARATYPSPAELRISSHDDAHHPLAIRNIGETEANDVRVEGIAFSDFPWMLSFDEIGSIPSGDDLKPLCRVIAREELDWPCEECLDQGKPRDANRLLIALGWHVSHLIRRAPKSDKALLRARYFYRGAFGYARSISVAVTARFYDGRSTATVHHRLVVEHDGVSINNINSVFLRTPSRDPVVQIQAPAS